MKTHFLLVILILMPLLVWGAVGPITVSSLVIDDDNTQWSHDNSQGDGNKQIAAGEKIRLVVKLQNTGTETATNVIGNLACDNPDVDITDASEEYKDINAGAIVEPYSFWTINKDGGFLLSIPEDFPTATVHFTINITANNAGPFTDAFDLDILGGTVGPVTIYQYKIDDDNNNFADDQSQGDGNQLIDPGETIGIDLKLMNNGTLSAINYKAKLRVNYTGITMLDSTLEYSVIIAGNNSWPDDYDFGSQFHFSVATDIVPGTVNFIVAIFNNNNVMVNTIDLPLVIEEPGTVILELANIRFDDNQEDFTNDRVIGNGNRINEPRETIEVTASMKNDGTGSALGVRAVLHNTSPHLAVIDSVEEFATVKAGQTVSPDGWGDEMSFIVKILNTAPTGDIICPVEITSNVATVFYDTLLIPVDASNAPPPGAVVILTSPADGAVSRDAIFPVKGFVDDPQTRVFLNNDSIKCENGAFLGYFLNKRGDNYLTVRGINSQEVEDSVTVKVISEPYTTYEDKVKFYLHNKSTDKIDYDFLSEFAPYSTTSEVRYYPTQPDSMEFLYPLDYDIQGDQYSFSLMLSSYSTTLYTCKILLRNAGEYVLASTEFEVSGYNRCEKTVTGIDPETTLNDTLVFRLCWNKSAHFWLSEYTSDLFGGSLATSYIYIPWFIPTAVEEQVAFETPVRFELKQNYPNPFNASTTISYELPENANVDLQIYNISGQLVRDLQNQKQTPGYYQIHWDGTGDNGNVLPSGVYFCKIKTEKFFKVMKMTLLK